MHGEDNPQFFCEQCDFPVDEESEFCSNCGGLFEQDADCVEHENEKATGVCVICCTPYCSTCVTKINGIYLCEDHAAYEIYEGRARVFGMTDAAAVEYVKECLEQAGLHPVLFSLRGHTYSLGGLENSFLGSHVDRAGHLLNEIKIMVPCHEVIEAERILAELDISDSGSFYSNR